MAETVRIDPSTHAVLAQIARAKNVSLTVALSQAVELLRREEFFACLTADFAALRADSAAWAEEQSDRQLWETTSADGLADE